MLHDCKIIYNSYSLLALLRLLSMAAVMMWLLWWLPLVMMVIMMVVVVPRLSMIRSTAVTDEWLLVLLLRRREPVNTIVVIHWRCYSWNWHSLRPARALITLRRVKHVHLLAHWYVGGRSVEKLRRITIGCSPVRNETRHGRTLKVSGVIKARLHHRNTTSGSAGRWDEGTALNCIDWLKRRIIRQELSVRLLMLLIPSRLGDVRSGNHVRSLFVIMQLLVVSERVELSSSAFVVQWLVAKEQVAGATLSLVMATSRLDVRQRRRCMVRGVG